MAEFHFFTDTDLLSSQTPTQAFGPLQTNPTNEFKLTSQHAATGNPKVYAVCDGILLAQEDTANPGKLNLVLKPQYQPAFNCPKISYFIYRGIRKSALVDGNDVSASGTSDLATSIWTSQNARNALTGATDNPPKEALGLDRMGTHAGTDSFDSVFYNESVNYQLQVVRAGWSMGEFDSASFGLEILLEGLTFHPELDLARQASNIHIVSPVSGSPTQAELFWEKHQKEQILNYLDPAAFFGSFYYGTLHSKDSAGIKATHNGVNVYDHILNPFFAIKDIVFLDIRNDYNQSFDYFGNYGTDIRIAFDDLSTPQTANYYGGDWPLFVIENSNFTSTSTGEMNTVQLSFSDGSGENTLPSLFLSAGRWASDFDQNPTGPAQIVDLSNSSGFSNIIKLGCPRKDNATSISSLIQLKYLKRYDITQPPPPSSGTVLRKQNFMDHLFVAKDMKIPFAGSAPLKSMVFEEDRFVDTIQVTNASCISKVGIAEEDAVLVFFAMPKIVRSDGFVRQGFKYSPGLNHLNATFIQALQATFPPVEFSKSRFLLSPTDVNYLQLPNLVEVVNNFELPPIDELIVFGVDKTTFQGVDLSSFESGYPIYLALVNNNHLTDDIGQKFTTFRLAFHGFRNTSGTLKFHEIVSNITTYIHGIHI